MEGSMQILMLIKFRDFLMISMMFGKSIFSLKTRVNAEDDYCIDDTAGLQLTEESAKFMYYRRYNSSSKSLFKSSSSIGLIYVFSCSQIRSLIYSIFCSSLPNIILGDAGGLSVLLFFIRLQRTVFWRSVFRTRYTLHLNLRKKLAGVAPEMRTHTRTPLICVS